MNIFYLDECPIKAAQLLCNSHIVKQGLESCQLMSAAHHLYPGIADLTKIYRLTHKNHPCTKWVIESSENYRWLWRHTHAIFEEYTFRYGKTHACVEKGVLVELANWPELPVIDFTMPALVMPDICKTSLPVESYRNYYRLKLKLIKVKYKNRTWPDWLIPWEK